MEPYSYGKCPYCERPLCFQPSMFGDDGYLLCSYKHCYKKKKKRRKLGAPRFLAFRSHNEAIEQGRKIIGFYTIGNVSIPVYSAIKGDDLYEVAGKIIERKTQDGKTLEIRQVVEAGYALTKGFPRVLAVRPNKKEIESFREKIKALGNQVRAISELGISDKPCLTLYRIDCIDNIEIIG